MILVLVRHQDAVELLVVALEDGILLFIAQTSLVASATATPTVCSRSRGTCSATP